MSVSDDNTPGLGHNSQIPTANQITSEMSLKYFELSDAVQTLLIDAAKLPEKIADKADLGTVSRVVLKLRDTAKTAESAREAEKAPYLRGGQAVDAFFKALGVQLDKTSIILNRRVNDYQQAQLAAERAARLAEQREAERVAEEARQKAERARKAEIKEAAQVQASLTERRAEEAREAALATPAGMVRERFADGPLVTMKTVKVVKIVDIKSIPLEELRPYLRPSAIEDAVKAWAKATEYSAEMKGVWCGETEESVVR